MKEENSLVVGAVLAIALSALVITGWIVYKNGPTEPLNALILIASNIGSGLIGYLTKGAVSTKPKG